MKNYQPLVLSDGDQSVSRFCVGRDKAEKKKGKKEERGKKRGKGGEIKERKREQVFFRFIDTHLDINRVFGPLQILDIFQKLWDTFISLNLLNILHFNLCIKWFKLFYCILNYALNILI